MRGILWLIWSVTYFKEGIAQPGIYAYHQARPTTLSPYVNGTRQSIANPSYTPDFRLEEPPFTPWASTNYETDRPYKISPFFKSSKLWLPVDKPYLLGCYCVTVYKRIIALGGCLVITTRHILTTATATDIVLRNYKKEHTLENILGAWYDTNADVFNSSLYMTPCRIHYHPKNLRDYEVNASHPIPCIYDLALWAATYRFQGSAIICQRAVSSVTQYMDPIPRDGDLHSMIGFQYIKAYNRRPMPWYKYAIRFHANRHVNPCPKTEWGWFICVKAPYLKYGIDSGAGMHIHDRGWTWRIDGTVGLGSFSLFMRAKNMVHYFTVLDTYPVLDFIYDAEMGLFQEEYLDYRFVNSKNRAPVLYWGETVDVDYTYGKEYYPYNPSNYRR